MAIGISLTPIGQEIDLNFGDRLAWLVAPQADYSDTVVIDVDEPSMARLAPQIGPWPYNRDVYALTNRYLLQTGAAAVAFDILFSEARRGDEEFAQTLTEKNILAAAALPFGGAGHDSQYRAQLGLAAWAHGAEWKAQPWEDLTLPLETFSSRAQVGVITLGADPDGLLRRAPLLHRAYGEVLPALAPAVLKASGAAVELNQITRQMTVYGKVLPVDDKGAVQLRFPKNLDLRVIPFYEIALAASGSPKFEALAATLRGKTVYIGSSSAVLGDFVQTPVGRVAGLYLAAAMPNMLKNGFVFQPRNWALDAAHTFAILLLALLAALPRVQKLTWLQIMVFPGLVLAAAAMTVAFNLSGQKIAVLLPMTAGLMAHVGALLWRQVFLYQRNQKLQIEKIAAEESNRLKGQFLSHMTHELRTPLTAILGYNNINWKSDDLGREQRIGNSQVIERNGRHLLTLINGILDHAKLEAGQVRIIKQPESLNALINDVVTTLRPLANDKSLGIEVNFLANTPDVVEVDAFRVRQILLNLVGNAIKFTQRGRISVEIAWSNAMLSIAVADTGPGLSTAQLARLFVPFQQASDGVTQTHGGTGLGLTISRELASLMDGDITVSSEVGVGTRFQLRVPSEAGIQSHPSAMEVFAPSNRPPLSDDIAAGAAKALHGTVLVAEDADDLRGLAIIYLKRLGLNVLEASDGRSAVEIAMQQSPDAILMDMEMPVMHGLEAVKLLRAKGFSNPILAMTAHSDEPHRTLALAAGCNDVLSKPVSYSVLRSALDGALSARNFFTH